MKQFLTILFISAGIFGFSASANAQKIGYISADEIIQLMPEAATVQKQLDQYQQSLYQNAQDQQSALNAAIQTFYKGFINHEPKPERNKEKRSSETTTGFIWCTTKNSK